MAQPIVVIGSRYCSPNHLIDLIMTRKSEGNFIVEDLNGNIMFKISDNTKPFHRIRRVLSDAEGKPLVTMQPKGMSYHGRWNVFKGNNYNNPEDLIFCAKKSSLIQPINKKIDVFLASNGDEDMCDFRIYVKDSNLIITQFHQKITIGIVSLVGKDKSKITVYPNIDCAFIVALIGMIDAFVPPEDPNANLRHANSLVLSGWFLPDVYHKYMPDGARVLKVNGQFPEKA